MIEKQRKKAKTTPSQSRPRELAFGLSKSQGEVLGTRMLLPASKHDFAYLSRAQLHCFAAHKGRNKSHKDRKWQCLIHCLFLMKFNFNTLEINKWAVAISMEVLNSIISKTSVLICILGVPYYLTVWSFLSPWIWNQLGLPRPRVFPWPAKSKITIGKAVKPHCVL